MKTFSITRINTDLGIYRIEGKWCNENMESPIVEVSLLEVMSTDGWVLLAVSNTRIVELISNLTPQLLAHLTKKYS